MQNIPIKQASERILSPPIAPMRTQWELFQDHIISKNARKSLKATVIIDLTKDDFEDENNIGRTGKDVS